MPLVVQFCIVVVTITVAGLAVMAIRLMLQTKALLETANRSLVELPVLIEDAKRMSARTDELLVAFSQITHSARSGASQFEHLATRTSALASTLLDEAEGPVTRMAGVIRSVRIAAGFFIQRWMSRAGNSSTTKQGDDHVGEQRWFDDGGISDGSRRGGGSGTAFRAHGR